MDIKAKTDKNQFIDIEVQINEVDDYRKRSLYYWSKLYGETILKGDAYYELKKSVVINIVDFDIIQESDNYHNVFIIKERDNDFIFLEDLEIHYLELGKFKTPEDINKLKDLEGWTAFLKSAMIKGIFSNKLGLENPYTPGVESESSGRIKRIIFAP